MMTTMSLNASIPCLNILLLSSQDLLVWGCCGPSNRVKSDDLPETDDPALRSEFPSSQDPRVFLATTGSTGAPAPGTSRHGTCTLGTVLLGPAIMQCAAFPNRPSSPP